jgi:hypothetical protein
MRRLIVMIGLILAIMSPARAEWRHARTDHFILTIDDSEENARDFAVRLERFDAALRLLYGVPDNPDQHLRPVAIYAFKEGLFFAACRCPATAGFYSARTDSSFIMTLHLPNIDRKAKTGGWSSQALLLHEYTHHFVSTNFPIAYPYWFQEGFAEFNANATFEKDGSLIIGYPANYRGDGLLNGSKPSLKRLFDPNQYGYGDNPDLIYGYGWLLTHYLMLKPERRGQLAAYLSAMNAGVPSLKAAQQAFGDLAALDKELSGYRRSLLLAPLRIPPGKPVSAVVTTLTPGEAAMLPVYAAMRTGGTKLYRIGLAQSAQGIAKRYPDDGGRGTACRDRDGGEALRQGRRGGRQGTGGRSQFGIGAPPEGKRWDRPGTRSQGQRSCCVDGSPCLVSQGEPRRSQSGHAAISLLYELRQRQDQAQPGRDQRPDARRRPGAGERRCPHGARQAIPAGRRRGHSAHLAPANCLHSARPARQKHSA